MKQLFVIIGVLVLIFGFFAFGIWNSATFKLDAALKDWDKAQVQCQARIALTPKFVEKFKEYVSSNETNILEEVTTACAIANQTTVELYPGNMTLEQLSQYRKAQDELTQATARMLVLVKKYPMMKLDDGYLEWKSKSAIAEQQIPFYLARFDSGAKEYDLYIETFPNDIFLWVVGGGQFKAMPFLEPTIKVP